MTVKNKPVCHYAIKCKLKSFLRFNGWLKIIEDRVSVVNKIWFETWFFFNLYILHYLEKNRCPSFDKVTIQRCALFTLGLKNTIKRKDDEYKRLDEIYNTTYLPIGKTDIEQYSSIKSVKKPLEFLTNQMMTNIYNYVRFNFKKFQKKYLKAKIFDQLSKFKIKKKIMYAMLACIQYHVNNNVDEINIKSKILLQFIDLDKFIPIMKKIILEEKRLLPKSIKEDISYKNLKNSHTDVLLYFNKMIKYLEENNKKRFSVLPQLSLGYTYVHFGSRFLSTIYDEWIDNLQTEINESGEKFVRSKYKINKLIIKRKVGIKYFENNYKFFYQNCFNLKKFQFRRKDGFIDNPVSILTNGYTVCVLFERYDQQSNPINENSNEVKNKINLDNHFKNYNYKQFKKGLFDADKSKASQEFLDKFNKTSIDPNNDVMLSCYDESGKIIKIKKGYYYNKSHISKNTRKIKKYIKEDKMDAIYNEFADICYKKTVSTDVYIKFIKKFREHQDKIWKFYRQNKVRKLEFDTYVNKKKAVHKIVRKIVPKRGKQREYTSYKNKYIDNDIFEKNKDKPQMVFFGKGNGSTTIGNLKHSGPKGPIKTIAKELCKYCPTILVDEYRTSKICSSCKKNPVEHPTIEHIKIKRIKDEKTNKCKKIEVIENRKSYKLCYYNCKSNSPADMASSHKIWDRDYNASRNILHVGINKLLGKKLGEYSRKKKQIEENICFSLEKQDSEKGFPTRRNKSQDETTTASKIKQDKIGRK